MRRTTALTATTLLGLAMLSPHSAVAAGETCRGEAATIVGSVGQRIVGTDARDVVVANGSARVTTLGGDDLVCIGPSEFLADPVDVDTGSGNDLVDGTQDSSGVRATLGPGADRFEGGPGSDVVVAGEVIQPADGHDVDVAENPEYHVDTETDVLLGGQGWDDLVSGQEGVVNPDTVLAGAGIDAITYAGPQAPGGQLDGGIGAGDRLVLALPPGATSIDPAVGHATMTGGTVSWARIEWFTLATSDDAEREVSYRGTDADDEVQVEGTVTLVADLAGGDDILTALRAPAAGSAIDAGPGRDVVMLLERTGRLDLDMRAGVLEVAAGSSTHALPAAGFEVAFIAAPSVRVAGTARRNYLVVEACRAEISGRGGADSVRSYGSSGLEMSGPTCRDRARIDGGAGADEISSGGNVRDTISGGPGRDQLWGARGPDRLTGGSGHDSVDGGPGPRPDTCRAEEVTRCER